MTKEFDKKKGALPPQIKAVIFDMDGTLFDTEKISANGWFAAGEHLGCPMSEEMVTSFRGNNDAGITEKLSTFLTLPQVEEAWVVRNRYSVEQIDLYGVPLKKGLRQAFDELKDSGIRLCVATGSDRERALRLCRLAGIDGDLEFCLCGSEVTKGKPAPDMYLIAANRLNLPPENCLVVEDSFNGVRAAHAAACPVIMIPDMDPPDDEMRSLCDGILESLDEIPQFLRGFQDAAETFTR